MRNRYCRLTSAKNQGVFVVQYCMANPEFMANIERGMSGDRFTVKKASTNTDADPRRPGVVEDPDRPGIAKYVRGTGDANHDFVTRTGGIREPVVSENAMTPPPGGGNKKSKG